jgi:hypothetical protein
MEQIVSLHRYYIWADRMRVHFHETLKKTGPNILENADADFELTLYMSYWYAALYVVVEGWQSSGCNDPTVDALLADRTMVDLLRRYRNGVFHFQRKYNDQRFWDLIGLGSLAGDWISTLHFELGRWLLKNVGTH